jgi:hypothetical protein
VKGVWVVADELARISGGLMREFEFQADEVLYPEVRAMIVDLESIVKCSVLIDDDSPLSVLWQVSFCDGTSTMLTESGFERVMRAWRSSG